MKPITYTTLIKKFDSQGEKTGWTYIDIPAEIAEKLNPGVKTSFRVKGKLDEYSFKQAALLPMGGGDFIMPLKADVRRAIGKRSGYTLTVQLQFDASQFEFSSEFMECLQDEPSALNYFNSLAGSHQKYFSKWIDSAKTIETKSKRIAQAIKALSLKQGYGEMIRANKKT